MKFQSSRQKSSGFTLVELLVVIVIIGLLMAITIPAITGAMRAARRGAVSTELGSIEAGFEALRTNKNLPTYPPGLSVGAPGNVGSNQYKFQQVQQFLGQMYRFRDVTNDVPMNPFTDGPVDFRNLDCAESLVLWLMGATDNQQYPLCGRSNAAAVNGRFVTLWIDPKSPKVTQYETVTHNSTFDFDVTRLRDVDQDGFPEYYPAYGGEKTPYVYIPSTEYQSVYASGLAPAYHLTIVSTGMTYAPFPYMANIPAAAKTVVEAASVKTSFAAADKYQIMAPGLDGVFMTQGNAGAQIDAFKLFAYTDGPYSDNAHKDNITNFAGGTLESKMP